MRRKVWIILGIVVIFVLFIILNLKSRGQGKEARAVIIKKTFLKSTVKADGRLKAFKQVEISSEVVGKIFKIFVKEGQNVKKGQLLCIIDTSVYSAKVRALKHNILSSRARYIVAKKNYQRIKELYESGYVSQSEYENAEADFLMAKARYEADSFALEEAINNLKKCFIRSPIDGEVLYINKKEGETVVVGLNVPASVIMVIADRSKMYVEAEVDETEVPKIKIGNLVNIKIDAFPDEVFKGKVVRVGAYPLTASTTGEVGVTYPVEIEILNSNDKLLPEMNASAEILVNSKDNVLVVPYSAIGKYDDNVFVWLSKGGRAKKVKIKTGLEGDNGIEVVSGIKEGDTLLIGPYKVLRNLKDGDLLKIKIVRNKFKRRKFYGRKHR